jgi:hypothetical protein
MRGIAGKSALGVMTWTMVSGLMSTAVTVLAVSSG